MLSVEAHLRRPEEPLSPAPSEIARLRTFDDVMARPPLDFSSARGVLGVVLPLSGPYAGFGEQALHG